MAALARTAYADWDYTKWGMHPADVINASRGRAVAYADRDHDWDIFRAEATAPYTWHGFEFAAYFLFHRDTQELRYVSLVSNAPERCPDLDAALRAAYGKPSIDVNKPIFRVTGWLGIPGNANFNLTFTKLEPLKCELRVSHPAKLR